MPHRRANFNFCFAFLPLNISCQTILKPFLYFTANIVAVTDTFCIQIGKNSCEHVKLPFFFLLEAHISIASCEALTRFFEIVSP